jgi:hypothetical protein
MVVEMQHGTEVKVKFLEKMVKVVLEVEALRI